MTGASVTYDLAIIGGGIAGAGIARDAAGRGASVLLLEAGDLAGGTSGASTKLIHGGLRYLEHGEFALVREALREREILLRIAPHLMRQMRFVLPVTPRSVGKGRPGWMLRAGLFLYDRLGGNSSLPYARAIDLTRHPAGEAIDERILAGFEYSDGWVDDSRLVILNAVDARRRGAKIYTRTPVTGLRRGAHSWRVEAGGKLFHARALVNAAGPAAHEITLLAGVRASHRIRRVRGSHIIVPRLFAHDYAYIFQLEDGRIGFAIPYEREFTLIGTTDRDHTGPLAKVSAGEDEIAYLCAAASRYFRRAVRPGDVVHTYSGVRALIDDGSGRPEAATRGYRVILHEKAGAPLVDVYGGKLTAYRKLAEEAVDKLADRLGGLSDERWTHREPLPGGDFPRHALAALVEEYHARYPFLSHRTATRIARAYGLDAALWLGSAKREQDLGRAFGAGLSEAEVGWLQREEWARTASDVLWRRSKLGLQMNAAQQATLRDHLGG